MKINNRKKFNLYTRGQQFLARILFIAWLLFSCNIKGALAVNSALPVKVDANSASIDPSSTPVGLSSLDKAVLQEALTMYPELDRGENHPAKASALSDIGQCWENLGKYKEARDYYQQALQILKELHTEESFPRLALLNNVGRAYYNLGQYEEARKHFREVFEMCTRLCVEENHPAKAAVLSAMGLCCKTLGQYQEALGYYQQARAMYQKLRDPDKIAQINYAIDGVVAAELASSLQTMINQFKAKAKLGNIQIKAISIDTIRVYLLAWLVASKLHRKSLMDQYSQKATEEFLQAIEQANGRVEADLYTTYSNFLLTTGQFSQNAYDYLQQAIDSRDYVSELDYSLEQPTPLRAIYYAYYLMIHHYKDFQQAGVQMSQSREKYLKDYQTSLEYCSGHTRQAQGDEIAYRLLESLHKASGGHEATATAFASAQEGPEQEDTQAAA